MSITLTGTGGLMTRLGRFGHTAQVIRGHQSSLSTDLTSLVGQYQSTRQTDVDGCPTAYAASQTAASGLMATLSAAAQATLIGMVHDDKPTASGSLADAVAEVIKQMRAGSSTVKASTIAATATAFSTPVANAGNGTMTVSTKRGDGLVQENTLAESAYVTCTADSQSGGATLGQEQFTYVGAPAVADVWSQDYPGGSGVTTTLTAVDASIDAGSTGNILTNSDFEDFTANLPDNWTDLAGVAGTDFKKNTSTYFDGTASLEIVGGGTAPSLVQVFNSVSGTTIELEPDTVYAVNFWAKVDVVPAAGVLTVDLVDGSNANVADDQSTANSFTVTCSGLTTSWVACNGFFRTPRALPTTLKIRVRISTGLSAGTSLFIDRLAMTPATLLYPGGPVAAIFSGQTTSPFVAGDGFTLATTNNYGGASYLSTFQALFDRLFGMRALGLVLPSTGSPSIADSLISS